MVISTLVSPLHSSCDAPLPVLHSATSEDRECGAISTNEAHALGLDDSIENDGVPSCNGSGPKQIEERQNHEPSAILRSGAGVVNPVPTLGFDQIPPSLVPLITGHNDIPDTHTGVLDCQLLLDLPDATGDGGDRGETLLNGISVAPVSKVPMPHVNGDVLHMLIRRVFLLVKLYSARTHRRDRLIRLKAESGPQIQFANGFDAFGPMHVSGDVSPRGRKVVFVFNILQSGGVRGRMLRARPW